MVLFLVLILLLPAIMIALRLFLFFISRRILVNDIKRAIIEAEYEIRRGNFELK